MRIVKGLFEQTLEPFLLQHALSLDQDSHSRSSKKISFVNMDMDLYSGAHYVLQRILPHLSARGVVHFHDFFNEVSRCRSDEMRALYDVLFNHSSSFGSTRENSIQLQMMPFETFGFRQPLVFRVV